MTQKVFVLKFSSLNGWYYRYRTEEEALERLRIANIRVVAPGPNTIFVIKMPPQSHYPGQDGIEGPYPMREWIRTYKTMRDNK